LFASARCRFRSLDLAGVWALSSHAANVSPLHVAGHWQLRRINAMSRVVLSCVDRAQREVLTLELALYHAARDYPGGAAAIAATTGRNATTLQQKLVLEVAMNHLKCGYRV